MKVFSGNQIKLIDNYTIENEPVKSIDLMERAAYKLLEWIVSHFERPTHFIIFIGSGNNGGDGLALARMLHENRYDAEVNFVSTGNNTTDDWNANFERIKVYPAIRFNNISNPEQFPTICYNDVIIDALFGTGLSRPADELPGDIIRKMNATGNIIISVDIPSGLFTEDNSRNIPENIIRASHTLTFHFPKLSFLFAENHCFTGKLHILPIGLHSAIIRDLPTPYNIIELSEVNTLLKERNKFDHKGMFGHGLLIAGSKGKMGAVVLAAKSALRTGIGLLTCHLPSDGRNVLNISSPEAMTSSDLNPDIITSLPDLDIYNSAAIGPGIGTHTETIKVLEYLFSNYSNPIVVDADAINIMAKNLEIMDSIPAGSVITPHPKEFERLSGKTTDSFSRLKLQVSFSAKYNSIVILKGAHTAISLPDGRIFFNNTGNPGMATAGSGDVLTGMILSLLAQGYSPENAAILGVSLHGLAGDIAAEQSGYESLIASDIIDNIGKAYNSVRKGTL
jgi:ADP-dependent NAD(P)H-hydrate dehydratase / NAD(P)H-hydrate epimerase